jgi:peptidoglycan/xylan/chitin deacetylase (PgdA/CDA1 family)
MMAVIAGLRILVALALLSGAAAQAGAQSVGAASGRRVAITIDDLPAVRPVDVANTLALTRALTSGLRARGVPATGFVNEKKLADLGLDSAGSEALLDTWLAGPLELGNHTYSHPWFWNTPLDSMKADVLRGERVSRPLCERRGKPLRWFRHPYLNTGPDSASKADFEGFLAQRGYRVAPVTFDNDEYVYARAYELARERGDRAACDSLASHYLDYLDGIAAHFEGLSLRLLGREPAQVLLLHANWLNAERLDGVLGVLAARGYRLVTLEEAMADPAYALPDFYIGKRGMSWLERWAVSRGEDPGDMPQAPAWVRRAAGLKEQG